MTDNTAQLQQLRSAVEDWPLFVPDPRGFYHIMMSLIISQRVRFVVGQRVRKRIYELLECDSLDRVLELNPEQRATLGLGDDKWQRMLAFDAAYREHGCSFDFAQVAGIGAWTLGCARIMAGDYSGGFVRGDLAVRKLAGRLVGSSFTEAQLVELTRTLEPEEGAKLFSKLWNHCRC